MEAAIRALMGEPSGSRFSVAVAVARDILNPDLRLVISEASHLVGSIVSSITIIRDSSAIARADHEPAHIGLTPLRATAPASDDHLALPSRLLRLDYRNTPSPELVQSSSNDFIQAKNGGGEIRTLGTPIRRTTVFETLKNPL